MRVESGYNPKAIGGVGERGLMQVLPSTATMLGFRGTMEELADPATNIRLGVTYLAGAWKLANGDLCRTLMKYRAGHNQERMSPLSVEYCRRAKGHLAALGSSLGAGALPAVTVGLRSPGAPARVTVVQPSPVTVKPAVQRIEGRLVRVMPTRTEDTSRRFWAAHEARIKALERRLSKRQARVTARAL
jgi:hypothetical protein